jgi:hypothetical protein
MQDNEPQARAQNAITPELGAYVQQAFNAFRLGLYAKYLTPDEIAFMQANYGKRVHEWVPLLARVGAHMESGADPRDPGSRELAREWMDLFRSYAGSDPATHLKIREAHAREPGLMTGTFISEELMRFIGQAMAG